MPTQDCVRHEQRTDFFESLAAEDLPFDCQSTALVAVQQYPLLAELLFENLVFCSQVLDHFLLLAIDPTSQDGEIELPGVKNEIRDRPIHRDDMRGNGLHHRMNSLAETSMLRQPSSSPGSVIQEFTVKVGRLLDRDRVYKTSRQKSVGHFTPRLPSKRRQAAPARHPSLGLPRFPT